MDPKIDLCGEQWCRCCARGRIWVKTCNICVISGLFCVILCVLWQSPLIRVWRQSHKSQIPGKNRFVRRVDETPACAEPMLSAGACSSTNKKVVWAVTSDRSDHCTKTCVQACATRCSSCSSARFISTPYAYPTRLPLAPITRWHGTMNRIGLRLFADPTARTAFGRPTASAICA